MQRRGRAVPDEVLERLSERAGFAYRTDEGTFKPGELIRQAAPQSHIYSPDPSPPRFLSGGLWLSLPREKAERMFQRGIKRTLALEHYEARGYFGDHPVEIFSTSPWHALEARRALAPFAGGGRPPAPSLRVYHEPLKNFSSHCHRSDLPEILLVDLREGRALIVGSLASGDILRAIAALAQTAPR